MSNMDPDEDKRRNWAQGSRRSQPYTWILNLVHAQGVELGTVLTCKDGLEALSVRNNSLGPKGGAGLAPGIAAHEFK
jgi:hypothetical protein